MYFETVLGSYTAKGASSYSLSSRLAGEKTWVEQVISTKEKTAEFPVAASGLYEVMVRPRKKPGKREGE